MHYTDKECDMSPYMGEYEEIKSVPIVQVGTAYDNPETGDTTILILNEEIWMGNQMENTLVKPKHICSYRITLQGNPFSGAPILISIEDHKIY